MATSEKGKLKKQYIQALQAQGDTRSYNEIQADLELHLWGQRWNSVHDIESAIPLVKEPTDAELDAIENEED
jgi:hypothetical protein